MGRRGEKGERKRREGDEEGKGGVVIEGRVAVEVGRNFWKCDEVRFPPSEKFLNQKLFLFCPQSNNDNPNFYVI